MVAKKVAKKKVAKKKVAKKKKNGHGGGRGKKKCKR